MLRGVGGVGTFGTTVVSVGQPLERNERTLSSLQSPRESMCRMDDVVTTEDVVTPEDVLLGTETTPRDVPKDLVPVVYNI